MPRYYVYRYPNPTNFTLYDTEHRGLKTNKKIPVPENDAPAEWD
jgi:hypothetical protein